MSTAVFLVFLVVLFAISFTITSKLLQRKDGTAPAKARSPLGPKILDFLADILDYFDKRKYDKKKAAKQSGDTNSTSSTGGVIYCPYCDSKVPKNARKCWNCKNKLPISFSRLLSSAAISVVCVLVILFCFSSPSSNSSVSATLMSKSDYISKCRTISYDKLARNPDSYKGDYFEFTGEVIQVIQSGRHVELRVNVTREDLYGTTIYSDTIYVETKLLEDGDRILEGDIITLYGVCDGLYTYTTIFGSSMSIPKIDAAYWYV